MSIKKGLGLAVLSLAALFAYIAHGYLFLLEDDIHLVFSTSKPSSSSKLLSWEPSLNLQQSHNACGPYSVMAYAFGKAKLRLNPENVNKNISGRYGENFTYPEGITEYLSRYKIETHTYFLGFLSNKQKLEWVQSKIESGNPVILVVGAEDNLHYITILGYKGETLYEYDSVLSNTKNTNEPGNTSENYLSIIQKMGAATFNGAHLHLAISI